jgi:uncharacterized protein YkwD
MRNGARRMMIITLIIAGTIGLQFALSNEAKADSPYHIYFPLVSVAAEPSSSEQSVADLINEFRTKNNLSALNVDPRLTQAARVHSLDMATNNFFSHSGSDGSDPGTRMLREGYGPLQGQGECIAKIALSIPHDPATVMNMWLSSPLHKAVIQAPYFKDVGIGYAEGDGYAYYTADFGVLPDSD